MNKKHLFDFKLICSLLVLIPSNIVSDRFCQISNNENCGESLKSGNCNLIKSDKYDYFEYSNDLVSMSDYKSLILYHFNKARNAINFEIYKKKRDRANERNYPMFEKTDNAVRIYF